MTSRDSWLILPVYVCLLASASGDRVCASPSVTTCKACLLRGPRCAWCFQKGFLDGAPVSQRCDTVENLVRKGCQVESVENPRVEVEEGGRGTQVAPRNVRIRMRPGGQTSFVVGVRQLDRYPVDLYYLVDVSASMQENLDRLKTAGVALSQRMREHSSDFRVGFGSFVDKPVSPYINVHPSRIHNPCSDYGIECRPAHGFIHVLPVTENMTEFTRIIQQQQISGNMDTPEGGFDAMLQAAVCQKDIGWRAEAKRLLLVMTDQPSHLALDSKLAGIVVPHDGRCHLVDNAYTRSGSMEHPSMGLLAEKLLENSIYSVFAVEQGNHKQEPYRWYEGLIPLVPGAYLGKLLPKASNLKDLVVEAYKKLLSDMVLEVGVQDGHVGKLQVDVAAICPEGSRRMAANKCADIQPNQTVYFNITVTMLDCPSEEEEEIIISVRPVGFNETAVVRIQPACGCRCDGSCQDEPDGTLCGPVGAASRDCGADPECSGRGACVCGRCVCDQSSLGLIRGRHCEVDDFSCPYLDGLLCGGRGQCVSGECKCHTDWMGESCGCPDAKDACVSPDGLLCSGKGQCVCGRCQCDDPWHYGHFCEKCPTCGNSCQAHWRCVKCHLSNGLSEERAEECNTTCSPTVNYVADIPEAWSQPPKHCLFPREGGCHYRFQMESRSGQPQLHISTHPECLSAQRYYPTVIGVFLLTVFLGLLVAITAKLLLTYPIRPFNDNAVYDVASKESSYKPTSTEKTITYRRDQPLEMHIHIPKMPLNEVW